MGPSFTPINLVFLIKIYKTPHPATRTTLACWDVADMPK